MAPAYPIAETQRLRIRRVDPSDTSAMGLVYGDQDAMRYVGDGTALSKERVLRWVEIILEDYARQGYGMFAVELLTTSQVIGFCGLIHPGGQEMPEFKYAYQREHWGQGYATEAGGALREFGANTLQMRGILATVDPEHRVSQRVLTKCGFTYRKTRVDSDGHPTAVWAWGDIEPAQAGPNP